MRPAEERREEKEDRKPCGNSQEEGIVGGVPRGHSGQERQALEWRAQGKTPGPTHLRAF